MAGCRACSAAWVHSAGQSQLAASARANPGAAWPLQPSPSYPCPPGTAAVSFTLWGPALTYLINSSTQPLPVQHGCCCYLFLLLLTQESIFCVPSFHAGDCTQALRVLGTCSITKL